MNTDLIKGAGVALVTPFDKFGQVDYTSLKKLVDYVICKGIDFIVAMGTTAEAATLSKSEKEKVLNTIIEENGKRVPLVVGIGGNNTQLIIDEIQTKNFDKIDAILSVVPYYNKPSQQGLLTHFSAIADAYPIPIILYNVPSRTACNLSAKTVLTLAKKHTNIIAIKEASGNFNQIMEIIKHKPEEFRVLSGDDALTLPSLSIGMEGVISVVANVLPAEMTLLNKEAENGNYDGARDIHYNILDLTNALFEEGNPAGIKAALKTKDIITDDTLRLPLVNVSNQLKEKINSLLK